MMAISYLSDPDTPTHAKVRVSARKRFCSCCPAAKPGLKQ